MPLTGNLQYQFSIPPDNSVALYMDAASPIATVCDDLLLSDHFHFGP